MRQFQHTFLVFATLAGLATVVAEPLSQSDRDLGVSSLSASRKLFLDSVSGLSAAQANWKPAPDKWSIAEVAEHIALAEGFIFQVVERSLQAPAKPAMENPRAADERLLTGVTDRSKKFQAPEPIQPGGKYATVAETMAAFVQERDKHIDYLKETPDPLREHFAPHPVIGELDAFQWILLMSAHTERHVKQIEEVKASPGYPSK